MFLYVSHERKGKGKAEATNTGRCRKLQGPPTPPSLRGWDGVVTLQPFTSRELHRDNAEIISNESSH